MRKRWDIKQANKEEKVCLLPMGVIEIYNAKKSLTKFNFYSMAIEEFKKTHFYVTDYMFFIVIYYSLWDADIFLNCVRPFKTNEKWEWV